MGLPPPRQSPPNSTSKGGPRDSAPAGPGPRESKRPAVHKGSSLLSLFITIKGINPTPLDGGAPNTQGRAQLSGSGAALKAGSDVTSPVVTDNTGPDVSSLLPPIPHHQTVIYTRGSPLSSQYGCEKGPGSLGIQGVFWDARRRGAGSFVTVLAWARAQVV